MERASVESKPDRVGPARGEGGLPFTFLPTSEESEEGGMDMGKTPAVRP